MLGEQEQQQAVARLLAALDALVAEDTATQHRPPWNVDDVNRLDLVAQRGQRRLAIEIDREIPRAKSIRKLRRVPGAVRVVLLHGGRWRAPRQQGSTRSCA